MHPRDRIKYRIRALEAAGQWRDPTSGGAETVPGGVDARSNDYLGLARRAVSRETVGGSQVGAGASRLVSGTWPEHLALEAELAAWLGSEAALVFSSGYAANVGTVSALAGPGETVLSDALNHASIIDGCRLSRAEVVVLPHGDAGALERALADTRGVRWFVTETYFGMDGVSPDLVRLRAICDRHEVGLVVDEAHALGVFGPGGRGLCAASGVAPDVLIGGMGKALGVQGGFAACGELYRSWLWNRARSLVFSTAPSPVLCALARDQVRAVAGASAARARLAALEQRLSERLGSAGVVMPAGRHGPVFPLVLGSEQAVMRAAARAVALGVRCQPIRPPTVPRGASRLRVSLRADMTEAEVDRIGEALAAVWELRDTGDAPDGAAGARRSAACGLPNLAHHGNAGGGSGRGGRGAQGAQRDLNGDGEAAARTGTDAGEAGHAGLPGREGAGCAPEAMWAGRAGHARSPGGGGGGWAPEAMAGGQAGHAALPGREGAGSAPEVMAGGRAGWAPSPGCEGAGGAREATAEGRAGRASSPGGGDGGGSRGAGRGGQASRATTPESVGGRSLQEDDGRGGRGSGGTSPPVGRVVEAVRGAPSGRSVPVTPVGTGRWVILGTGTDVGKTFVARSILDLVRQEGRPVAGLKPIETGLAAGQQGDAARLADGSFHVKLPTRHPLYAFADPITPARAARISGQSVELNRVVDWLREVSSPSSTTTPALVIETAGGVFSPLTDHQSNFDLARALDPAVWVLVATNRLGVLHEVTSTLRAMEAAGRLPDWLVLSAPQHPDASTPSNREELTRSGRIPAILELPRDDPSPLAALLARC